MTASHPQHVAGLTTADVVFETTRFRCRGCGKALALDVGGSVFGDVEGQLICFNCDPVPQTSAWDARLIREAVAQVVHDNRRAA